MLRILFVSLAVPFPATNGHRLRNLALLQALGQEGHEVTLVSFAEPHEMGGDGNGLRKACRQVEFVPVPPAARQGGSTYWSRLRALASPLPFGVWRFRSEAMRAAVRERLAQTRFDLVICDDIYNVRNLPPFVELPVLLNKHDITHVILERYLAYEANPLKRAYGWVEYRKLRRWEALTCGNLTGVLACSETDRKILEVLCPGARVGVLPNVIDLADYVPTEADDNQTVLYVGALDWYPNQDAVEFFVSEIFPMLRETTPGVKFVVAGRHPPEEFRRRFASIDGIEFTGTVPDIRTVIAKAAVCVVPLRIGSGTRLKILEGAAMGKPVVSTRIGAEGLEFVDGQEILLADQPSTFARAVADLLADAPRRRAMGLAARRRVERQYSLSTLRTAVRRALAHLAENSWALSAKAE